MPSPTKNPGTPRSEDPGTPSKRSTRDPGSQGSNVPDTPSRRSTRSTPSKRTRASSNARDEVPDTPTHSTTESVRSEAVRWGAQDEPNSDVPFTSPVPAFIPPTSPGTGNFMSEIDLSSPLNYGTPSSLGSVRTPRSGIRGTPIRMRPDIRTDKRIRQVNIASDPLEPIPESQTTASQQSNDVNLVVWGTNVSVAQCKEKFKQFILRYIDPNAEEDERMEGMNLNDPLYMQKLDEIHSLEEPFLNVNCSHLETFDANLYRQLVCYPQEVIPIFDMCVNEMFYDRYPAAVLEHQIQVRPFNAEKTKNMRSLNPEDIDQLITISGMVIRTSNVMPEMREAFFKCIVCSFSTSVEIDRGRIAEPTLCSNCNTNHCFSLVHNRSQFTDKQMVKLQESPDDMPAGQTPHTVVLFAHNDLVDAVSPGDRVTVTGIYRALPLQVNPRMRNIRAVYKTHIDVLHFRKIDNKRLYEQEEGKDHRFPPERVELLQLLSQKEDIYDRLAHGIAPSIYENDDVKKGILLQLFGGTKKDFKISGRTNFRAEINILLCGDPGTSKSQLLQYVYNLVPRSQYTSGKGSSAVGLTAYVTKDAETRQLVLQTGALVLADNGICCIDEFDKMNESTRSILHEVMEQQTLSIAKAGIICQLNARTSILAAANPSESQWNKNKTIIENVQLPHTLMSRFDLIFLILDPQDDAFDRRLARHLVSLYYKTRQDEDDDLMDMSILRDYIAYAKEHIHPKLCEEASQRLIQVYVDMRKVGSGRGQISAYPRQLESLIRLSEAHAKMRFSPTVEVADVEEAWRLHREALKQSATDPLSGKIDVSILTTGLSSTDRKRKAEIAQALATLIKGKGGDAQFSKLNYQKVLAELKAGSQLMITRDMFDEALKELQDKNIIKAIRRNDIIIQRLTLIKLGMNPIHLQKQIRDNASDLETYIKDLNNWKDEMKRKEEELAAGNEESSSNNIPPPRKVQKATVQDLTKSPATDGKLQRLKSFDYEAWDKFDVEAECKKVEENESVLSAEVSNEESSEEEEDLELRDEAVYEKEKGNNFVKLGRWKNAIECYTKAIENYAYDPIFYANRALCYLKLDEFKNAETDCTTALQMDKTYVKAYQRRAAAREKLGQISEAINDLQKVIELEPKNSEAKNTIYRLEKSVSDVINMPSSSKAFVPKFIPSTSAPDSNSAPVNTTKGDTETQKTTITKEGITRQKEKISKGTKYIPEKQKINWPLGDNVKPVKLIKKLPHQRSKKPLKKIEIQKVEFAVVDENYKMQILKEALKSAESALKQSKSKSDTQIESSEEEEEEKVVEKSADIKTSQEIKARKTFKNDLNAMPSTSKVTTKLQIATAVEEQESVIEKMDFNIPKSSVQFYGDWKLLQNKPESKYTYLRQIPPQNLPNIFKESLESDLFTDILETIAEFFVKNADSIYGFLNNLSNVKRFTTLTMFLSSKDKLALQRIFQHMKETEERSIDDINILIKKYEM